MGLAPTRVRRSLMAVTLVVSLAPWGWGIGPSPASASAAASTAALRVQWMPGFDAPNNVFFQNLVPFLNHVTTG
jgi:hypothetical protein